MAWMPLTPIHLVVFLNWSYPEIVQLHVLLFVSAKGEQKTAGDLMIPFRSGTGPGQARRSEVAVLYPTRVSVNTPGLLSDSVLRS